MLVFLQWTLNHGEHLVWFYVILFVLVFCECGFLAAVLMPGDSVLIFAGSLTTDLAKDLTDTRLGLSLWTVIVVVTMASILGYWANYWQGAATGSRVLQRQDSRFFKKKYLLRTQTFFEKHGGKTILFARFVAYVRTFAPFVAGMGRMPFWPFTFYNIIGGGVWSVLCVLLGHYAIANPIVLSLFGGAR
jgi:membrane-associated protein